MDNDGPRQQDMGDLNERPGGALIVANGDRGNATIVIIPVPSVDTGRTIDRST